MEIDVLELYQGLESMVLTANPHADPSRLRAAFEYARDHHGEQKRKSGEPYIIHPIAVAELVFELGLDQDSIIAALLHDCIEDTDASHGDIARQFGPTVANLVEGVTKLTRMQYTTKEEEQMENLRKMFMAMAKDVRVILIKLCDRLHNMRTLQYQSDRKQKEKALETMEIYAPIAHRLGMQRVKWELEDLSLQYLDPVGFAEIQQALDAGSAEHDKFLTTTRTHITQRLEQEGVKCTVYGRVKHIYSIYRKMYTQDKTLKEIFDLYAFRVIVEDIPACYNVLGCIHDMYNPVLGRFKDYIGTPKPNGYQSLHTTVIGGEGVPFEVQIRTYDMHQTAEYGIAAHWKYKQGMGNEKLGSESTFEWVRKLLEAQQDTDPDEFVHSLRVDLFSDEVFVFTPQGDVKSLPAGATPIDFAYSIHSAVGNRMTGALVNGRLVPFDTVLQSGDIVEVLTSKSARGPSRDWMKLCKSNEARNKIRQWFKKERREENIITGRASFEAEVKHLGLTLAQVTDAREILDGVLKKAHCADLDELYAAIGYGGVSAQKAVGRIKDEITRLERQHREQPLTTPAPAGQETVFPSSARPQELPDLPQRAKHTRSGITVQGLGNCMVKFSKCCAPVPGDPIIGFITRGYGVSVHRKDCPNASPERQQAEPDRWVAVSWAESGQELYQTALELSAKDRDGLALDVASALSTQKVKVNNLSARAQPDGYATVYLELSVHGTGELTGVINKLSQISGVFLVKRSGESI